MIKYPVSLKHSTGPYVYIQDADGRAIAGGLLLEDAEEIVARLNAPARTSRRKSREDRYVEQLKNSDIGALTAERDNIVYGPHDSLPQAGEHVARLGRRR